jgi:betaine-aldehyde dehydrogenase
LATTAPTELRVRNFIGGQLSDAADGATEDVVNPATGEAFGSMAVSTAEDVDAAVAAAAAAARGWATTPPAERSAALFALADLCQQHIDELARLEALDAGKPITAARTMELPGVIDGVRLFAAAARTLETTSPGEYVPGMTSIVRREPVGVIAAVTPWNYPFWQAVFKIAPALATGNTMVLKPAETTPVSVTRLAELARDLFPPGVLNIVHGHGPVAGERLVSHPDVAMVSFTGSVTAGRRVGVLAAEGVKRSIMELGGNAPVLVFSDASVDLAVEGIIEGGLYNAGQECMASHRVLVARDRYDELVSRLAERARSRRIGDTMDAETELGPLNSEVHRARVEGYLARRADRTEVVTGGGRPDGPGFFLEPTVVTGVEQDDELVQEEIFGPVFTVQAFDDEDEAVFLGNDTRFGLASSVWTHDVGRAIRCANALDFGTVWVNNHFAVSPELPVGGYGESGYGTEGGLYGVAEYTRLKHVGLDHRSPAAARGSRS